MNLTGINIRQLDLPANGYVSFTYPRLRKFLNGEETRDDVIAVGLSCRDIEIGLALLSPLYEDRSDRVKTRRLWSIMVASRFRRNGLGEQLITACERLAIESGARKLVAFHSDHMKQKPAYENLLKKCRWANPHLHEFRMKTRADWCIEAENEWHNLFRRVKRNGFGTVPWRQLDAANRRIAAQVCYQNPGLWFQPFSNEEPEQPELSIGICRRNELVGWIMGTWLPEENTARYTNGYVRQEYQRRGWLIAAMVEVCKRQSEIYGADSLSINEVSGHNRAMQHFMKKRLEGRWSVWSDHRFVTHKMLGNGSLR